MSTAALTIRDTLTDLLVNAQSAVARAQGQLTASLRTMSAAETDTRARECGCESIACRQLAEAAELWTDAAETYGDPALPALQNIADLVRSQADICGRIALDAAAHAEDAYRAAPPTPSPMSGADLRAAIDASGHTRAAVAAAAGLTTRAVRQHIARGPAPLALRHHHAYAAALASLAT